MRLDVGEIVVQRRNWTLMKTHLGPLTDVARPARLQLGGEHVARAELAPRWLIVVGGRLRPPGRPQDHRRQIAALFDHASRACAPISARSVRPGSRFGAKTSSARSASRVACSMTSNSSSDLT